MHYINCNKILRLQAVKQLTGLSRSTIYAYIQQGHFPKQVSLGPRMVGWSQSDIDSWIQCRIKESSHDSE